MSQQTPNNSQGKTSKTSKNDTTQSSAHDGLISMLSESDVGFAFTFTIVDADGIVRHVRGQNILPMATSIGMLPTALNAFQDMVSNQAVLPICTAFSMYIQAFIENEPEDDYAPDALPLPQLGGGSPLPSVEPMDIPKSDESGRDA